MVAIGRALTSLVLVTALAGSSALVSLCLVACMPGMADAAAPAPSPDATAPAALHAHHGAATAMGTAAASTPETAQLDGECHDCCADAATALDASQAGERPGAVAATLNPASGPAGPMLLTFAHAARPLPPPVSPPTPVRASLVLRI